MDEMNKQRKGIFFIKDDKKMRYESKSTVFVLDIRDIMCDQLVIETKDDKKMRYESKSTVFVLDNRDIMCDQWATETRY
jgi:hypothetical protein